MMNLLQFAPYAWAKFLHWQNQSKNECFAFGIAQDIKEPLRLTDLRLIPQIVSSHSVEIDGPDIAEYYDTMLDQGLIHKQFARIFLHTHPGRSNSPSVTDQATFDSAFGECDWAIMFILANNGTAHCEISFNVGPHAAVELDWGIDWQPPFEGATNVDYLSWTKDYQDNVIEEVVVIPTKKKSTIVQTGPMVDNTLKACAVCGRLVAGLIDTDDWCQACVDTHGTDPFFGVPFIEV